MNVVWRGLPFHWTMAPLTKFVPLTVSVNAGLPTTAESGLKLVSAGTGLGEVIVKVSALDAPPPGAGLKTVISAIPIPATSVAGIRADNCEPLANVVVRALPFHRTMAPGTKFVPLTVNVNSALPAGIELGLRLTAKGAGLG